MTNIECVDMIIKRATAGKINYESVLLRTALHQNLSQEWQRENVPPEDLAQICRRLEDEEDGYEHAQNMLEVILDDVGLKKKGILKDFHDARERLN
jgi:hypothetical protein